MFIGKHTGILTHFRTKVKKKRQKNEDILSQIETSGQVVIEPTDEMPFVRRLFAKLFRPSVRQGLVVLFDQGFRSGSTFLASLLVGRACGKEEYGLYTLFFTFLVSGTGFQTSLTGTPYITLSPGKTGAEKKSYLGSVLFLHLVLSVTGCLIILVIVGIQSIIGIELAPNKLLFAFSAALVFVLFRDFMRQVLLADLAVWQNLFFGIAVHVSTMSVLLWLYLSESIHAHSVYIAMALCSILPVLVLLWHIRENIHLDINKIKTHVKDNWQLGRWLVARTTAILISGPLYCWALGAFKGPAVVGLYGACMLPIAFVSPIGQAMDAFMTPKASHAAIRALKEVKRIVFISAGVLGVPLILFSFFLFLFSDNVMVMLFDGKYLPSPWLLLIFALQMAVVVLSAPVNSGLIALKRTDLLFKAQVLAVIVTLTAGIPLVYFLGIWGVALGFLITRLSDKLYQWVFFFKLTRNSFCEVIR